jgi:putative nucleotidyltransferase with HDIG domain
LQPKLFRKGFVVLLRRGAPQQHNKTSLEDLMNRSEALSIVQEYIKSANLINHMLAVEAAMRFYARRLGEDEEAWGLTGLLHDFDWEIHPTAAEHPLAGAPILRERGVPEDIVHAILTHGDHTGIPRETLMEKALFANDEITGLVTAVALVRPSRSLYDLTASSVKKKWKDRAFAAGANREEISKAAEEFGVDLWEHTDNVILAMRGIAPQLGLEGNIQPQG